MSKELYFEMREEELSNLVEDVEQGKLNALRAYAEVKQMESYVSHAKKQIEPLAFEEAEKYPDKTFHAEGHSFEKRNGGRSFSYKNISLWQKKSEELKHIEKQAKLAFEAKEKGMLTASEDGEEIELPEVSYRKDSLVVKKN